MSQPLTIADAIEECRQVFRDASKIPHLLDTGWVENRFADFNLWCAGVNASGSENSSLQARLSTDLETHIFLINLLKLLKAFLKRCVELGTSYKTQHERGSGHTIDFNANLMLTANSVQRSPFPQDVGLSRAMNDVQDTLSQLARVTVAIRKAGANSRMQKADAAFDKDDPEIQA